MKVDPICKYGHGPMDEPPRDPEVIWAIRAVFKEAGANGNQIIGETSYAYTMHLFRCKECGYIEFFDDEI